MQIISLHRYPIKGCHGQTVDRATVDALGMVDDRRLMLVDDEGRFLSQRQIPSLARIRPILDGSRLTVQAEGIATLEMEVDPHAATRTVSIWNDQVEAADQGEPAAAWFSTVAGRSCRLVGFGVGAERPIDPQFTPRPDAQTAFTDGYPLLGMLQESLDDLNSRLAVPVAMASFRPTVVLAGAPAWSEDGWTTLRLGELVVDAVKPCARCVVTTIDQESGTRHPRQEPLRTLATFRTVAGMGVLFGQNLVPRTGGEIVVGMEVRGDR
ncbi:MAG: MOSC N-terminal beta barrel domain-containing protein [Gemmatimonadales bacterium]|nr:MOSC N-terminal beta barrel domain-containing protein [Gemmatimonadales bacterium]